MHTHSSIHLGAVRPRSSEHTKHPDLGSYKSLSTKRLSSSEQWLTPRLEQAKYNMNQEHLLPGSKKVSKIVRTCEKGTELPMTNSGTIWALK